jgi:FG-GAP-like repeat
VQNPLTGHMVLTSATEGTALPNSTTVATFSDTDNADMAGDFSATINWGDGVTTAGTVVGSSGTFSVQGGHTYADEGSDPASVTITHTADNVSATASGSVAVGEGDVLTGHGTAQHLQANHAFTGVVATFSDTYTGNVPGDFSATISWGDGSTTAGTVSGGSGSLSVSGTHIYTHAGHENISVTLNDDAPGTATATANSTANVSNGPKNDFNANFLSDLLFQENVNSAHPNVELQLLTNNGTTLGASAIIANTKGWPVVAQADFNNDNMGDVVLQNTDGTPEIWLVNGTSVTSRVDLAGAGSGWHIIAASDFNNDGHPDLLFQSDGGQVGLWMMNGTSVVSMNGLANPGSSWHVIGAGDFNNDGNADILFQNTDGTPMIWEMNGTSVISQATLTNPGSQWKAIQTGDFNGDGNADILFQVNNGQAGVWLMNGTSVVSMTGLGMPGPNYNAIGTSDFNGDGKADILFQNSNGTPQEWLMNGSTVTSIVTLPNPGAQWQAQADGPFQTDAAGVSSGTPHLSTPDMLGTATQTALADPSVMVPGTQNFLQQQLTGAGLHLT